MVSYYVDSGEQRGTQSFLGNSESKSKNMADPAHKTRFKLCHNQVRQVLRFGLTFFDRMLKRGPSLIKDVRHEGRAYS